MLEDGGDARVLGALLGLVARARERLRAQAGEQLHRLDLGVVVDARLARAGEELAERALALAHGEEDERSGAVAAASPGR